MSATGFKNFQTHTKSELIPFGINAALTAATTYGGQYLPKVVEVLSFEMAVEALGVGSALVATGGSLATIIGKTALGEEKYKTQAYSILTYAVGAFAAACIAPQAASLLGMAITFENAMALFAASTAAFAVRSLLFSITTRKSEDEKETTPAEVKNMDLKTFNDLFNSKKAPIFQTFTKNALKVLSHRVLISHDPDVTWNTEIYNQTIKDNGSFSIESYKLAIKKENNQND